MSDLWPRCEPVAEACDAGLDVIEDVLDKYDVSRRQIVILIRTDPDEVDPDQASGVASSGFADNEELLALILGHATVVADHAGLKIGPLHWVRGGRFS